MGADEDFDVTHSLTMLAMNEICVFSVHVQQVFEHAEDKPWDGEYLGKGPETKLAGEGNKERDCQQGKEHPPLFAPSGDESRHEDGDASQQDNQNGTGNESLLDGLIDKINLSVNDSSRYFWQIAE